MKFLAVIKGQNKVKYENADTTVKTGKCTAEARAWCLSNLKKGDPIKAKFENYEITKVEKFVKADNYKQNGYKKPFKSYNSQDSEESLKRQIFATAGNIITQIKGIEVGNYSDELRRIYNLGIELVLNKSTNAKAATKTAEVEEEEVVETTLPEEEE